MSANLFQNQLFPLDFRHKFILQIKFIFLQGDTNMLITIEDYLYEIIIYPTLSFSFCCRHSVRRKRLAFFT